MVKTYLWMAFFLGLNWGGFIALLLRTLPKDSAKAGRHKVNGLHPQPTV
jgi:hypothetical protein